MSEHDLPAPPSQGGGTQTEPAGSVGVLEKPDARTQKGDGDGDRLAHIVYARRKVSGRVVIALCGKVWIPTRNPKNFPVCPTCKALYESLKNGSNGPGNGGSGDSGSGSGSSDT